MFSILCQPRTLRFGSLSLVRVRKFATPTSTLPNTNGAENGTPDVLSISPPPATPYTSARSSPSVPSPETKPQKINDYVRPDHGLYAFFRKKEDDDGKITYHTVEPPDADAIFPSGRAWKASELRLKSFKDLHTLWYIVLRERNLLATQREEARRMGVPNPAAWSSSAKASMCRKTMARIKYVLNERRLAYEGASKLIQQEAGEKKAAKEDEKVHKYNLREWRRARRAAREATRKAKVGNSAGGEQVSQKVGVASEKAEGILGLAEPEPIESAIGEAALSVPPEEEVNTQTEEKANVTAMGDTGGTQANGDQEVVKVKVDAPKRRMPDPETHSLIKTTKAGYEAAEAGQKDSTGKL